MSLRPGEGVFFSNPLTEPILLHLTGEILQGDLSNSIPAEVCVRSSMVPQGGLIQGTLGYIPASFDSISILLDGGLESYYFFGGEWSPFEPAQAVGEAAFIDSWNAKFWRRRYFVWP